MGTNGEIPVKDPMMVNLSCDSGLDVGSVMPGGDPENEATTFIYTVMQQGENENEMEEYVAEDNINKLMEKDTG